MIIVAKSIQEPGNHGIDYVEASLPDFRDVRSREKCFAYAWTFNPDDQAIAEMTRNLPSKQGRPETWLYLIGKPRYCLVGMHIVDFRHDRLPLHCPQEWKRYCIQDNWCISQFPDWLPIHLWFLVDQIVPIKPPMHVGRLTPLFANKYRMYGPNSFGFFH